MKFPVDLPWGGQFLAAKAFPLPAGGAGCAAEDAGPEGRRRLRSQPPSVSCARSWATESGRSLVMEGFDVRPLTRGMSWT